MTTKQFEKFQKDLGLDDKALATLLDVNPSTVWRWRTGKRRLDRVVELALMQLVQLRVQAPKTEVRA